MADVNAPGEPLDPEPNPARKALSVVVTVALTLAGVWALQTFVARPFTVPSGSMLPTIEPGDALLIERFSGPRVGDIWVFRAPEGALSTTARCASATEGDGTDVPCGALATRWSKDYFVKRIVAGPGDRVQIREGVVIVNGEQESGYRVRACDDGSGCDFAGEIRVPERSWYLVGDNRGESFDSRFWGPVPDTQLEGRVLTRFWPLRSLGRM